MDISKQRRSAVAFFVAVVIVFSLIGCHLSLSRAARRVEEGFFDKLLLTGYGFWTAPGDQLNETVKYANRLLSVINGSDELTEGYIAVRDSRQALADALAAKDIPACYDAAMALSGAVSGVDAQVQAGAMLPPSNDDYDAIVSNLFSSLRVADQSPYNQTVDDFMRKTADRFPASVMRRLSFARMPDKYE